MYQATAVSPLDTPGLSLTICQNRAGEDFVSVADIGDVRYYAVFDGHGCKQKSIPDNHVAVFMKDNLHHLIARSLNRDSDVNKAVAEEFVRIDRDLYERGFKYGTTCGMVLVAPDRVYQINLGDSGSIIFDNRGEIVSKTADHVPSDERERIVSAGGFVKDNRVNGILAMSRSIGDYELKMVQGSYSENGPVIPLPTITSVPHSEGLTLVLGTDGMHNGCSVERIRQILRNSSLRDSSENIYHVAKTNNHNDDVTVLVVHM